MAMIEARKGHRKSWENFPSAPRIYFKIKPNTNKTLKNMNRNIKELVKINFGQTKESFF
jgi:hypothetical protein